MGLCIKNGPSEASESPLDLSDFRVRSKSDKDLNQKQNKSENKQFDKIKSCLTVKNPPDLVTVYSWIRLWSEDIGRYLIFKTVDYQSEPFGGLRDAHDWGLMNHEHSCRYLSL